MRRLLLPSEIRNRSGGRSVLGVFFCARAGNQEPQAHDGGARVQKKREGWDTHFRVGADPVQHNIVLPPLLW